MIFVFMGGYAPPQTPSSGERPAANFWCVALWHKPKIRPAALGGQGVWGMKSPIYEK